MFNKKIIAILTIAVASFMITTSYAQDSLQQTKNVQKLFLKCLLKGAIAGVGISTRHAFETLRFDKPDFYSNKNYFRKADESVTLAVASGLAAEAVKLDDTSLVPAFVKDITNADCNSLINYLGLFGGSLAGSMLGNSLGSSLHKYACFDTEKHAG